MDEPKAADHSEADRLGEQVFMLVPKRPPELAVAGMLDIDRDVVDQQRDRDREDAVAEGDDPRELDLVLLSTLRSLRSGYSEIIEIVRDGTARGFLPRMPRARRRSSVGRALHS